MGKERKGADLALHFLQEFTALADNSVNACPGLFPIQSRQSELKRNQALRCRIVHLASHSSPLVFLCSKKLASHPAPLAFESNELCHVANADQYVVGLMNSDLRDGDVEIVTREGSCSIVDAVEARPHAGHYLAESVEDRDGALIATFDQSLKEGVVVATDVQADPCVALNLSFPSFIDRNDRSGRVDESNLLNEAVDHLLDFVEGKSVPAQQRLLLPRTQQGLCRPKPHARPRNRLT